MENKQSKALKMKMLKPKKSIWILQMKRRRTFRSHGRITYYLSHPFHLELIVTEKQEDVIKGDGKKAVKLIKKQAARQRLAIGSVNQ